MAIMTIAFSSILAVEAGSINATTRAKQMNVVAMLARNKMIETEYGLENKQFNELQKEETGAFEAPYADYSWKVEVKEIEFPNLNVGGGGGGAGDKGGGGGGGGAQEGQGDLISQMTKILTGYLSKALREVQVSILWKKGSTDQSFTVTTYWVDLNHELNLTP